MRLIDADALPIRKAYIVDEAGFGATFYVVDVENIDCTPTVDAVPVVHGRWERVKNPQWPAYSHDKCNICGWWNTKNAMCYDGHKKPGHSLNYCPNCGADMRGE